MPITFVDTTNDDEEYTIEFDPDTTYYYVKSEGAEVFGFESGAQIDLGVPLGGTLKITDKKLTIDAIAGKYGKTFHCIPRDEDEDEDEDDE